jgi:hypothetical protein
VGWIEPLANLRRGTVYALFGAGLITLVVAFIRTAILPTEAWLVDALWVLGAIFGLLGMFVSGSWKVSKA